uniref:Lactogenin (Fragments) n=1 Tax=Bos taurus TaxID=9913 RepID=LGEN_BOVIN|nr:RecName: Full=Lactogenin [Bos taurus]
QGRMYQRFLRQHVDPDETGGNDHYLNLSRRNIQCPNRHEGVRFNTDIHEDLTNRRPIDEHEGVVRVTDKTEEG